MPKPGAGFRQFADHRLIDMGKTQTDLGRALGFSSRSQVTHLLDGRRRVDLATFVKLCDFFRMPMAEMLRILGYATPKKH